LSLTPPRANSEVRTHRRLLALLQNRLVHLDMNNETLQEADHLKPMTWEEASSSESMKDKLIHKLVDYLNSDVRTESMLMDILQMGGVDYVTSITVKSANQEYLLIESSFNNSWGDDSDVNGGKIETTRYALPWPWKCSTFDDIKRALQHWQDLSAHRYEGMSFIVSQQKDSRKTKH
jgi:hypothetical protein